MPEKKISLKGYIDVPADRADAVKAALPLHIDLTRAESGCISFQVNPCPDVEGRYLVVELFTHKGAFDIHQARASQSEWAKVTKGIPRRYEITEVD